MTTDFATFVEQRFGGKLTHGKHAPDGAACFMEALNVYQGKAWSDDTTGTLDLRERPRNHERLRFWLSPAATRRRISRTFSRRELGRHQLVCQIVHRQAWKHVA